MDNLNVTPDTREVVNTSEIQPADNSHKNHIFMILGAVVLFFGVFKTGKTVYRKRKSKTSKRSKSKRKRSLRLSKRY